MLLRRLHEEAVLLAPAILDWRRHFHAHPERSWQETQTTNFVADRLREWGYESIRTGFCGTASGLTAEMGPTSGPLVALRADLDALPIEEATSLPFRSCTPGVMHACGHDGHAAILLGAARLLALVRDELPCRVRLIFQPAEEDLEHGGAQALIREGVLDGVSCIGGLHLISYLPSGTIGLREGPLMASGQTFQVLFTGRGGHGGMPHAAIDPTIPLAQFILAVQALVARECPSTLPSVVSTGRIHGGEAPNVIPNQIFLNGTIRTFDERLRHLLPVRLRELAEGYAKTWRCTCDFSLYPGGTAVVNNDPAATRIMRDCATELVGAQAIMQPELQMISEDFSYYQQKVPGIFLFLGSGNEAKGTQYAHHCPLFDIDEDVLPTGAALLAGFAVRAQGLCQSRPS